MLNGDGEYYSSIVLVSTLFHRKSENLPLLVGTGVNLVDVDILVPGSPTAPLSGRLASAMDERELGCEGQ